MNGPNTDRNARIFLAGRKRTALRITFWGSNTDRNAQSFRYGFRVFNCTAPLSCRFPGRPDTSTFRARVHGGISFFSHRAPGMGNFVNSEGRGAVSYFSRKPQTHRQSRKMRTKPRLSSRFCLFCGAKLAKPSPVTCPVRRLSTLNRYFWVLEPQSLVGFSGAERGGGVSFSRLGGS